MKRNMRLIVLGLSLILCLTLSVTGGFAKSDYPNKPITLVCQFAAGGSTDLIGRALATVASKYLGQPVVVENKPGASGTIGTHYVLTSKPDGYTLLTTSSGNFTSTPLTQQVPYDPIKDVKHIFNVSEHAIVFVVNADSPWKTVEEFAAYVKQNPGKLHYGQNSPGGATHMAMEMFRKAAKLDMKMIPYGSGGAEVVAALLGKHVDCAVFHPQEVGEHIKQGKLRALTVFSNKRLVSFPDIPTAKEKGYKVVLTVPKGISGPAKLPSDVVKKLHDAFKQAMNDPEFIEITKKIGENEYLSYMSGPEISKYLNEMYYDMEPLIKELGLYKK